MNEIARDRVREQTDGNRTDPRTGNAQRRRYGGRASRPPSTYRTTLYRLNDVTPDVRGLHSGLNHRYLRQHQFSTTTTEVAGAPALLVHGQVPQASADWCPIVTGLTGDTVTVSYSSAGCALLIAVANQVYALTYGVLGRFMINTDRIDPAFGIAFAIRAIEPERVRRVTRRVLASTGRVDRNLVPGGQHIRRYGIEGWGEIVGQLCGTLTNERLTVTRGSTRPVSIAAADSLQIAISTDPGGLLDDLREISRVCAGEAPSPELDFIAQIRPLRVGERTAELDERLDEILGLDEPADLGIAVPIAQVEHEPFASSYMIKVPYRREHRSDLDLDAILEGARSRPPGRRLEALKLGAIGLCADPHGREPLAPPVSAHKWITAEIPLGAARMIYHEGRWYEIGEQHLALLRAEIEQILSQPTTVVLPPWTSDLADEDAYNRSVARPGTGYVLLDKHGLKTRQHNRGPGIEACDLLGPGDELIHVKRGGRSAPLSHLFIQGEVSVDALLHEPDARERLVAMVHAQQPTHHIDAGFKPRKVIYAIAPARGKTLTADTLFTFSQVALYRAVRRLRGDNIDVEVVTIPT
ncbi:DUF6119 family protein [Micromonospora thermarum]|uniref:TIGR04141 family sporadically distributed protein n=1 Tax=Micromonospora thermarum TaxID=2720024 RepID=A0ABX0ZA40_9ACTN|nr:DUF6119 family protein [Micromonospora thermarum]NJP32858.1 TIGR04141 family sporadically distributed protein [Micromonospora thermarum]